MSVFVKVIAEYQKHVTEQVKQRLSLLSNRQAVEFLSNEGHIFSTIDEDHYKSTDNDE